jgi:thiamine pyrophosphokinase
MSTHALIIANGLYPAAAIVRQLKQNADIIVCADGGANLARALRIRPDAIVGDFDSILPATRKHFRTVPQIHDGGQNNTDLEKAILFCISRTIDSADIVGATGGRLDHTLGNIGCFRKFGHRLQLRLVDTIGVLQPVGRSLTLKTLPGRIISLIPIGRCAGVTTTNLKYRLSDESLEIGVREGTSNRATSDTVTIRVKRGTLLCYIHHPSLP